MTASAGSLGAPADGYRRLVPIVLQLPPGGTSGEGDDETDAAFAGVLAVVVVLVAIGWLVGRWWLRRR